MLRASDIEQLRVDKLSISTSLLVRAAERMKLSYQLLPEKIVLISDGDKSFYFKGTSMPCNNMVSSHISINKYASRQLLKAADIPVPKTMVIRNPASWHKALSSRLQFPLVVKPIGASHGNGATMNIQQQSVLKKAVQRAFRFMKKQGQGDRVLIEEYFTGEDLRLLVIDDQVVSVIRRRPAYVVGDGHHTIRELINLYNAEWQSTIQYDYPMCPIVIDSEVHRYLRLHGNRFSDVPKQGEEIQLRWNGNVSTGGRPFDITDEVHPAIKAIAVKAAQTIQLPIAGVDLLVKDVRRNDTSQHNVVTLEVNDAPGLDIHQLPFSGTGKDIGKLILEYIFGRRADTPTAAPIPPLSR